MAEHNQPGSNSKFKNYLLNTFIIALAIIATFLGYHLLRHATNNADTSIKKEFVDTTGKTVTKQPNNKTLQIDVQNGCGETGVADKFTEFLRSKGYDVVEMGNYSNNDVQKTIVIDRTGNLKNAKLLASSLGVTEKQVIQQMNNNYFLDATVVIGKDYQELNPYKTK